MSTIGTVLIVDDDRQFVTITRRMLETESHVIATAESGERALEVYAEVRPGIVLLDVGMPGMGGLETCRRLKQAYLDECAPVIFFTLKNEPKDIAQGFAAGGVDYLTKPCSP